MACACRVTEEINRLQKEYAVNKPKEGPKRINWRNVAKNAAMLPLIVVLTPIMFIHIMHSTIKQEPIRIEKLVRFGK